MSNVLDSYFEGQLIVNGELTDISYMKEKLRKNNYVSKKDLQVAYLNGELMKRMNQKDIYIIQRVMFGNMHNTLSIFDDKFFQFLKEEEKISKEEKAMIRLFISQRRYYIVADIFDITELEVKSILAKVAKIYKNSDNEVINYQVSQDRKLAQ